jgi:hypothetical protein
LGARMSSVWLSFCTARKRGNTKLSNAIRAICFGLIHYRKLTENKCVVTSAERSRFNHLLITTS